MPAFKNTRAYMGTHILKCKRNLAYENLFFLISPFIEGGSFYKSNDEIK